MVGAVITYVYGNHNVCPEVYLLKLLLVRETIKDSRTTKVGRDDSVVRLVYNLLKTSSIIAL